MFNGNKVSCHHEERVSEWKKIKMEDLAIDTWHLHEAGRERQQSAFTLTLRTHTGTHLSLYVFYEGGREGGIGVVH